MDCPSCAHANAEDSVFCEECGAKLERPCASCGTGNSPAAKFCRKCGTSLSAAPATPERAPRDYTPRHLADKILQSKSALEGERKQVTVLFADVKGSMELAEQVDPEEWHRILERFFEILADGVHRFEGTVNQYTGDGIMALFGAPIAHEDHAQRACYAALHLREELRRYADELRLSRGIGFSVRMGVNSGEVIVGKIGDDLRMDYTAQGPTVGLAARMEQLAAPNAIALTAHTAGLVSGYFALRDLGASEVRGASAPVRVFELERSGELHTRFEVARARGLTRFVGRERDMQALEAALASAQEGHGQVVGVVAQAGIGKSRLCFEFLERCRADGLRVLEGHAVAHGKNVPLLPMLQVFRAYYGITDHDDDQTAREKIAGRLLLIEDKFREVLPLIFEFFGVADPERPAPPMDPEARQRQLFGILRRVIQGRDAQTPDVTLVEDLHWIDAASEAFLEQWVEAAAGARGLLLVNFRPEYHAPWMQKSYYHQLPLSPLGVEATRELLADLLGTDPSLEGLAETIQEHTRGNPFFTEEVVRALIEGGSLSGTRGSYRLAEPIQRLEVPETVQPVLAARIDRLQEREKRLLQTASVIGKEFSEPLLEAVAELPKGDLNDALAALESGEFLYEQALYPVVEYAFKHPLTQEVAYNSQLGERRSQIHAAVARAIEERNPEKLDEQAALLAHHWEQAGEALEAARWHRRAARWAGVSNAAAAHRHWRSVRSLLGEAPESAETLELGIAACGQILQLGWRVGIGAEEAASLLGEGRALAERSADPTSLAQLLTSYAVARGVAGDLAAYQNYSLEAACAAEQTGDLQLRMDAQTPLIYSRYLAGHTREALESCDRAIGWNPRAAPVGTGIFGYDSYVWILSMRGGVLCQIGRLEEAADDLDRALHLARQQEEAEITAWTLMHQVLLASFTGDRRAALEKARRAFEIAERVGSSVNRMLAHNILARAHLIHEAWDAAIESAERSLAILRESGAGRVWEPWPLAILAGSHLGRGDFARARTRADEGLALTQRMGTAVMELDLLLTRVNVLLRSEEAGARDEIERDLARARSLVEETAARSLEPRLHEARAELARVQGDEAGLQNELREAHRLYTEMGATGHAKRLAGELGL